MVFTTIHHDWSLTYLFYCKVTHNCKMVALNWPHGYIFLLGRLYIVIEICNSFSFFFCPTGSFSFFASDSSDVGFILMLFRCSDTKSFKIYWSSDEVFWGTFGLQWHWLHALEMLFHLLSTTSWFLTFRGGSVDLMLSDCLKEAMGQFQTHGSSTKGSQESIFILS